MIIIITATFKLRGSRKEIERVKGRIAAISEKEEVVTLHIREVVV